MPPVELADDDGDDGDDVPPPVLGALVIIPPLLLPELPPDRLIELLPELGNDDDAADGGIPKRECRSDSGLWLIRR